MHKFITFESNTTVHRYECSLGAPP